MNSNDLDTTKTITHVSLCAGYGGIDLGLKRVLPNLRTVAFSEIEAFACANLVAKMEAGLLDAAPIWTDLKTFPWDSFHGKVGILSGGYPCQPFSAAGKRLGTADPRHLWPFIADGIRRMQPAVCFFENVEGHISLGLREVIGELESLGYAATWGLFSAAEVGAPHQRKRVFILAHRVSERGLLSHQWNEPGQQLLVGDGEEGRAWPSRPGQPQFGWEPPRVVGQAQLGNADNGRQPSSLNSGGRRETSGGGESDLEQANGSLGDTESEGRRESGNTVGTGQGLGASRPNRVNDERSQTESSVGRNFDGPAGGLDYAKLCVSCDNRTDELRLLGNGVVPATAERAFRVLSARFQQ